jgi:hypothetical protein
VPVIYVSDAASRIRWASLCTLYELATTGAVQWDTYFDALDDWRVLYMDRPTHGERWDRKK